MIDPEPPEHMWRVAFYHGDQRVLSVEHFENTEQLETWLVKAWWSVGADLGIYFSNTKDKRRVESIWHLEDDGEWREYKFSMIRQLKKKEQEPDD